MVDWLVAYRLRLTVVVCVCVSLFNVEGRVFPRLHGSLGASEAEKPWSRCGTYDGQIGTACHLAKLPSII